METITPARPAYTFPKKERLCRQRLIDRLFAGGSRAMTSFPLRLVYQITNDADEPVSLLISVPKKRFRRAVRRNRAKRQVREAYRHHKHALTAKAEAGNIRLVMAVIWLADTPQTTAEVDAAMAGLLQRLTERL